MSLKIKLMSLMIVLTAVMLLAFGALMLRDFRRDKIAYVLDSGLAHSRSVSLQIQAELQYAYKVVNTIMTGNALEQSTNAKDVLGFWIYGANQTEAKNSHVFMDRWRGDAATTQVTTLQEIVKEAVENQVSLRRIEGGGGAYFLGVRYDNKNAGSEVIVVAFKGGIFMEFFNTPQMLDTYLVTKEGRIVLSTTAQSHDISRSQIDEAVNEIWKNFTGSEIVKNHKSKKGEGLLVSASRVESTNLSVFSFIPESAAFAATKALIVKSSAFLVFLFFLAGFISVVSSSKLTSSLVALKAVTERIATGDFGAQVDIQSRDEVGSLAASVNQMSRKILNLMGEVADKARMESELKTAQLVQATLFPKTHIETNHYEVRGHYQPASECSGDWWFYEKIGDRLLLCIGDATGHGVPAALITSAIRSAESVVSKWRDLKPSEIMEVFNHAVFNTADGKVMMTLFLAVYDTKTGILEYSSSSHNPPYLIEKSKTNLNYKDLTMLLESEGPRLGEALDSKYNQSQLKLNPGDRIVFYTDGVTELKNLDGKEWGDRQLGTTIADCANKNYSMSETIKVVNEQLHKFRNGAPLEDDVTFFMFERKA